MSAFTREELRNIANCLRPAKCARFENGDACGLWMLNSYLPSLGAIELHTNLQKRWTLQERIADCANFEGRMYVSESGRDCDGVQYSGKLTMCDATLAAFHKLYADTGRWADGPFQLTPLTWDEVKESKYSSRDLTMEAFEDGHAHTISSARYDEDGEY